HSCRLREPMIVFFYLLALLVTWPAIVHAAEQDLTSALGHLQAGRQIEAAKNLERYRAGVHYTEIRRSIDRVLRLLREPLSEELRGYIALTLDESIRRKTGQRTSALRPGFV